MENNIETNALPESEFLTKNVTTLFWKYSLLALAGMIFQFLTVFFDGVFVGNGVGPLGLAGVAVCAAITFVGFSLFMLFGVGAATVAAVRLGTGDAESAREAYGKMVVFAFYVSAVIAIIGLLFLNKVLTASGAAPEVLPMARQYAIPYFVGLPFYISGAVAYCMTRVAEKPAVATLFYIFPAILCIAVEYYMIYILHLGMWGSGVSTIVCTGLTFFLIPYLHNKTLFRLKASDFKIDWKVVGECCKIGFPQFAIYICTTIYAITANNMILKNGGTPLETAAFGIVNGYIGFIFVTFTNSFCQGIQPIASFNTGAKSFDRVAKLLKIGVIHSTLVLAAITVIVFVAAAPIVKVFAGPDPTFDAAVLSVLRVFLLMFAFGSVSTIVSAYFLAVEKVTAAIITGVARMLFFAIPLLFVIPQYFGLKGVWMAQPIADALAFILAVTFAVFEIKRLRRLAAGA